MMILASKSPRRKELLGKITKDFVVQSAEVDETLPAGIAPAQAVLYLSAIKASPLNNGTDIVLGADTVVALEGEILGKPGDAEDARRMLTLLSGKTHSVFTGVTVLQGPHKESFFCETKVTFYSLSEKEITAYINTGEGMDKAGAYGIQGVGALLVEKIDGDYFNVVGLPVSRLYRVLNQFCQF